MHYFRTREIDISKMNFKLKVSQSSFKTFLAFIARIVILILHFSIILVILVLRAALQIKTFHLKDFSFFLQNKKKKMFHCETNEGFYSLYKKKQQEKDFSAACLLCLSPVIEENVFTIGEDSPPISTTAPFQIKLLSHRVMIFEIL